MATVTHDSLLSQIESQCPRLASNSYVTKDDLEPGDHLPCKAFLKWPKPEDLKQVCEGTFPSLMLPEGRNLEPPHNCPGEPVFRQR